MRGSRERPTATFSPARCRQAIFGRREQRDDLGCGEASAARALEQPADLAGGMVLSLVLATPAAFMYGRYEFPLKKQTFWFMLLSPLMPAVALLTPIYMMIEAAGLLGTKSAIIILHTVKVLPFIVLILSVFFRKMPSEIFEAAVIDGCGRFEMFWRIAVPVALPSIAATGLFAFMLSYSEYMYAFVMSGDETTRPISVVMAAIASNFDVSWSLLNTAIFIAIVPTTILVALTWRYVVEDLVRGAVKGEAAE